MLRRIFPGACTVHSTAMQRQRLRNPARSARSHLSIRRVHLLAIKRQGLSPSFSAKSVRHSTSCPCHRRQSNPHSLFPRLLLVGATAGTLRPLCFPLTFIISFSALTAAAALGQHEKSHLMAQDQLKPAENIYCDRIRSKMAREKDDKGHSG